MLGRPSAENLVKTTEKKLQINSVMNKMLSTSDEIEPIDMSQATCKMPMKASILTNASIWKTKSKKTNLFLTTVFAHLRFC